MKKGGVKIVKAKKEYPLSREEFEEKIISLLLEVYGGSESKDNKLLDFVATIQDDDDNDYLDALYGDSCYREDKYGNAFTDEELIHQPVRLLYMIYED